MDRLDSARKDEEEKKKRLNPDLSKVIKKKKKTDSIDYHNNSMIDMNTLRKNLHYELHDNNNEDYEDYNEGYY